MYPYRDDSVCSAKHNNISCFVKSIQYFLLDITRGLYGVIKKKGKRGGMIN